MNYKKVGIKRVDDYVMGILNGSVLASSSLRSMIDVFVELSNDKDIYFDTAWVQRIINAIENNYRTVDNKKIVFYPFQAFIIAGIHGWFYKEDNYRVVKEAFILMTRGGGKSFIAAILGIIAIMFPDRTDKEKAVVNIAANSKEQAGEVFKQAKDMCKYSVSKCRNAWKIPESEYNHQGILKFKNTDGQMFCISADKKRNDGKNPSCFIYDEVWAAKDSKLKTALEYTAGKRENPLGIYISTAGDIMDGLLKEMYDTYKEELQNKSLPKSKFALIYDLDDDEKECWEKCIENRAVEKVHPLYIHERRVRNLYDDQLNNCLKLKSEQPEFKTKLLNVFVENSEVWISANDVRKRCTEKVDFEDYRGCQCWIGLDLSSVSDLTSVTYLIFKDGKYIFKSVPYLPKIGFENCYNYHFFKTMHDAGYLKLTPSATVDYNYVTMDIERNRNNYNLDVMAILFDFSLSGGITPQLQNSGFHLVKHGQGYGHFGKPTKELELLIIDDNKYEVIIDDNPMTRYCFKNSVLKTDNNNNPKPFKKNDSNKYKIDIVITMIQALSGFMHDNENGYVGNVSDNIAVFNY
ncbi:hypothetical protein GCQ56_07690 [Marinifilum sp. N1E240]|uniref:terminase large subunit domain-containing protein n=1 Tax=Marinifilum sp. N1E240 TaxID=2608082 RepID=UPI00128E8032|nr:terminase large subunit [Marinifilum sp. N1E240]MPQ46895.1 hypothetical protein [Marinifilum sp. N1E240]